ncbi:MAG: hypothetical protein DRJ09_02990 [Bacteroidetes bacterium]|nr:MAG: hypothetical protein DRJ09_02990 [Bacteroidota bacterium]
MKINLRQDNRHSIEYFVEEVSNKLHINETYFGNLLTSMEVLLSILTENQRDSIIEISYNTDYQTVTIIIVGVSRETEINMKRLMGDKKDNASWDMFTLFNLSESFEVDAGKLFVVFDIGALNRLEYKRRKRILQTYFSSEKAEKPIKSNDQFYL